MHEGTYIEHPSVREQRKLLAVKGDNDDEEIPLRAVPSIGELRHPSKQQELQVREAWARVRRTNNEQ